MKQIRLLAVLVCYMLSFLPMEARRVDVEKAEKAARSHARSTSHFSTRKDFRLSKTVTKRVTRQRPAVKSANIHQQQDEPMFYVFTTNGDKGFIIISGDDVAKPVLGYSDEGTYDGDNPNFAYWMETLSQEIADAIENSLPQDGQIKAAWDALENEDSVQPSGDCVEPLIKTKWGQSSPYDNLCPVIAETRAPTGCVATAMAQIMNYHRHPASRTATIPGYDAGQMEIDPITGSTVYDWDNMTDTYSYYSSTSVENRAVATLMYECGVSLKMIYTYNGSDASSYYVTFALNAYFGYDAGMSYLRRGDFQYAEWIELLKSEIRAGRPVYYDGENYRIGHGFVCDGYDTNDMFHFNWGWEGLYDGYFEVSALIEDYNMNQTIITGIQPGGGQLNVKMEMSSFYANKTSLDSLSESFSVIAGILENTGYIPVSNPNLGILLCTEDSIPVSYQTQPKQMQMFPYDQFIAVSLLSNCSLPSDLPVGKYRLYPAYSPSPETEPSIIPGKNGNPYIPVTVNGDGSVNLSDLIYARTPVITEHPKSAVYAIGETAKALSVSASVTDGGTLSYQWYTNTSRGIRAEITGATSAYCTPSTATLGTVYYYVQVTNTGTIPGSQPVTATSNQIAITVQRASLPAPDAPTPADMTTTSVTLNTIPGAEYRIGNANWQDSPTFGGLVPNTAYTFYARMKETATHSASPASGKLSVTTPTDADAGLLSLAVNGNPLSVAGRELDWQAECGETSVRLDIEVSYAASATVSSGGVDYGLNAAVPLSGDLTVINIDIVSGDRTNTGSYSLAVASPIDADAVFFRRWGDVIAVNSNPANNGNRDIRGVRWYRDGNTETPDSSQFIRIREEESYHAEINIADRWHNVCGEPKQRSVTLAAYPNPVSVGENLTLQLPDDFMGGYMNVVSLSGSTVKRKLPLPDSFNTVSVADWAPGVYLLDITAPNGDREAVKIIVN